MDLSSWWLNLLMLWTLSSESLVRYFRIWIVFIIRLNFWFRFRIRLLLVLSKLWILFYRFLLIKLFHCHVLIDLWIITVSFMTWFILLCFLSWQSLKLILTGFVLLSVYHHLFITVNTLFSLVLNLLYLDWLFFRNHVLLLMFLFNDLLWLIHNLLNLNIALFTFIRVAIIIILIVISMSELPFYSVIIVSNIIQLLM